MFSESVSVKVIWYCREDVDVEEMLNTETFQHLNIRNKTTCFAYQKHIYDSIFKLNESLLNLPFISVWGSYCNDDHRLFAHEIF